MFTGGLGVVSEEVVVVLELVVLEFNLKLRGNVPPNCVLFFDEERRLLFDGVRPNIL